MSKTASTVVCYFVYVGGIFEGETKTLRGARSKAVAARRAGFDDARIVSAHRDAHGVTWNEDVE